MNDETKIQNLIECELSKYGVPIRLNSGTAWNGRFVNNKIINPRPIKLCPAGTPDLMCILPKGKILWVECKTLTGKQRDAQKKFQKMLEGYEHTYLIARCPEDITKFMEDNKNDK